MKNIYSYINEKLHLNKNQYKKMTVRQKTWDVHRGDTVLMIKRVNNETNFTITIMPEVCIVDAIIGNDIFVTNKETGKSVDIKFDFDNHQKSSSRITNTFAFGVDHVEQGVSFWAALMKKDKALPLLKTLERKKANGIKTNINIFNGYTVTKKLDKNWVNKFIDELNESN